MNIRRGCVGAATIEFALAVMLLFTVLFSIIDFGYLFWVNLTMQHAVREGARVGILRGKSCTDVRTAMQDQAMGLWTTVNATDTWQTYDPATGTFGSASTCTAPGEAALGTSGQIVVVSVVCDAPPLTPFITPFFAATGNKYHFTVAATVRME